MGKKYFAFISYKREDEEWAKWFQNELENYHLPSSLNGKNDIIEEIPEAFRPPQNSFRPVFRDIDELKAGNLPTQIHEALKESLNLVVICSRHLADDFEARWVNKEISDFIEIGKNEGNGTENIKRIYPFIVDGIPHADDENECFPMALRNLSKEQERIGGNINEGGDVSEVNRERAFVKVLAGMLPQSVTFDMLWDRYDRDKRKRENREKAERDKLLIAQSRFISEKTYNLVKGGDSFLARMLALKALPNDLERPDRPYTPEAEAALRNAIKTRSNVSVGIISSNDNSIISCITISPDGNNLAVCSGKKIIIYDIESGSIIKKTSILNNHSAFSTIVYSKDGDFLYTGDNSGYIGFWDLNTSNNSIAFLTSYQVGSFTVSMIAVHPKEKMLAIASENKIYLLDLEFFTETIEPMNHTDHINSVMFSDDGNYLISSSDDNKVIIWDVQTGEIIKMFKDLHNKVIKSAFISPDNTKIVTASEDGRALIINVDTNEILHVLNHPTPLHYANFNHEGDRVITACENVYVWDYISETYNTFGFQINVNNRESAKKDIAGLEPLLKTIGLSHLGYHINNTIVDEMNLFALSPIDDVFACIGDENKIHICYIHPIDYIKTKGIALSTNQYKPDIIINPIKNTEFALVHSNILNIYTLQNVDDIVNKRIKITDESKKINKVSYSWDGNNIVTTCANGNIKIWNSETLELEKEFNLFSIDKERIKEQIQKMGLIVPTKDNYTYLGFSIFKPNDKQSILTFYNDKLLYISFDGDFLYFEDLNNHAKGIDSIAIDEEGKYVLTVSYKELNLWDANKMRHIKTIKDDAAEYDCLFSCAKFSNDGQKIASGDMRGNIVLWNVEKNKILFKVNGHSDAVHNIEFIKNNGVDRYVISSSNKTIIICDIKTGKIVDKYTFESNKILNFIYCETKSLIIVLTEDKLFKCINFYPLEDLIRITEERFKNRSFTIEEKNKYYLE